MNYMPTKDNVELNITKLDHHGRGISYLDGKIVFVENALPGEKVLVKITNDEKKYMEAKVVEYLEKSNNRVKSKCPYYLECGGCHLRHMSYSDTLDFKKNKVSDILRKYANISPNIEVIKNPKKDFYRNKIEVKIQDGIVGFYKKNSHDIVELDRCLNAEEAINSFLLNIDMLGIKNGEVVIKSNYNGELIIVINTSDANVNIEALRDKHKIVGIILNDKILFGTESFIEIVDNMFFKESYNSFFQVNRNINLELFKLIKENIEDGSIVLDLCSGVGTLSIVASEKAKEVYAIEIVENAVKDALINAKMNKKDNINFMLGDAFKLIDKIEDDIDTVIVDPPRSGLNREALESILKIVPKKMIYISCDPLTLARDLKVLKSTYEVKKFYLLDMFSYTYHVETVMVLEKKDV